MRLLADENFPRPTVVALRDAGHDVIWARTDLPGTPDAALIELAEADGRVLVTLDNGRSRSSAASRSNKAA